MSLRLEDEITKVGLHSDLEEAFTYHAPSGDQVPRYQVLRAAGFNLAELILNTVPACRERDLAIDRIREGVMWANAGIACNERIQS